jgi:hypothetical protein
MPGWSFNALETVAGVILSAFAMSAIVVRGVINVIDCCNRLHKGNKSPVYYRTISYSFCSLWINYLSFKLEAFYFGWYASNPNFAPGEMAEWSIAAVLKTVEG